MNDISSQLEKLKDQAAKLVQQVEKKKKKVFSTSQQSRSADLIRTYDFLAKDCPREKLPDQLSELIESLPTYNPASSNTDQAPPRQAPPASGGAQKRATRPSSEIEAGEVLRRKTARGPESGLNVAAMLSSRGGHVGGAPPIAHSALSPNDLEFLRRGDQTGVELRMSNMLLKLQSELQKSTAKTAELQNRLEKVENSTVFAEAADDAKQLYRKHIRQILEREDLNVTKIPVRG